MPTGSEIRRKFLDFFVQKGHREVHSSSLVPANDPTLLFTNAGMNQFKDVFLGLEKRDYNRATTSQKCVRAGGKHNDLENVGFTNRHHTFFEMLGNFSFGDYFKKDAIAYAWELITSPDWYGIAKDKLYVTVFNGEGGMQRDAEAYDLWAARGVPKDRIFEMGLKDNFWQMGDTGPCGPCSEIHYDMGPAASEQGHTDCAFTCDCGRYVEIWNLVFMQFDRIVHKQQLFDSDNFGDREGPKHEAQSVELRLLPKPSIDTGMGLERVTAVLQGVISNYDTDLFTPLVSRAAELTGASLKEELDKEAHARSAASLRVIADHSRAAAFLMSDDVRPSNQGRGSVLRKIISRAITHGRLLGQERPFFHKMIFAVRDVMKDAYPDLNESADRISHSVLDEEERFARTTDLGLHILYRRLRQAADKKLRKELVIAPLVEAVVRKVETGRSDKALANKVGEEEHKYKEFTRLGQEIRAAAPFTFDGSVAFDLYATHGLQLDFIRATCQDLGVRLDEKGFESAKEEERQRARASWKGAAKQTANPIYHAALDANLTLRFRFEGYSQTRSDGCEVLAIFVNGHAVQSIKPGEKGEVVLLKTPFYAESGGQVGDRGWFLADDHNTIVADVTGCYFPVQYVRAHQVISKQTIQKGDKVDAVVNTEIRQATMRNHTGTHLLHAGLREILGKHVKQAGSLVAPNHLRFDFSHFTAVEDEELQDIEDLINKEVLRNTKIEVIENVPIDVAVNEYHAMALFGEKYGDKVRVVKIGDFSTELCGGTHTAQTGEIGLIKILKEGSVSSGVRRVEAVTGEGSVQHFRKDHKLEKVVRSLARMPEDMPLDAFLRDEINMRDEENERLRHELDQLRMKSASASTANIGEKIKEINGVKVLAHRVDNLERAQMRTLVDQLRDKLGSGVVVLGSATNGNVSLIVGVTKDLTSRVQAGKVIGPVAQKVGGKGGGRPDLAEAGGKDPAALDAALGEAYGVVEALLG